jgi:hypothetical protein
MQTVNKEITLHRQPLPTELDQIERALAIVNEIEVHITEDSVDYPRLSAYKLFIGMLSKSREEDIKEEISRFQSKQEDKLNKFQLDQECFYYQTKAYEALA